MLDKKDAQWWVLEAEQHPEAAIDLIRILADRLAFLDKQNEELRAEAIALKRRLRGETMTTELADLQRRIQELERLLRQGEVERRLLVYGRDRIEINHALSSQSVLNRELAGRLGVTVCSPAANLLILTEESRAFQVSIADLPVPEDGGDAVPLGNPRDVAAIIDRSIFERKRFLLLLSERGYLYSVLAGTVSSVANRQEKLIRNLIPGDPIIAALPSQNGDLFAISARGRWTRFSERTIAGSGSQVMDLPKGDRIAGLVSLVTDGDIVFLSAEGRLYVRESADLPARKAPGSSSGMLFKSGTILSAISGQESTEYVVLTRRGNALTIALKQIRGAGLTENGASIPGLGIDDSPVALIGL